MKSTPIHILFFVSSCLFFNALQPAASTPERKKKFSLPLGQLAKKKKKEKITQDTETQLSRPRSASDPLICLSAPRSPRTKELTKEEFFKLATIFFNIIFNCKVEWFTDDTGPMSWHTLHCSLETCLKRIPEDLLKKPTSNQPIVRSYGELQDPDAIHNSITKEAADIFIAVAARIITLSDTRIPNFASELRCAAYQAYHLRKSFLDLAGEEDLDFALPKLLVPYQAKFEALGRSLEASLIQTMLAKIKEVPLPTTL